MVKSVSKMLLKYGKIIRGWMGFYTRNRPLANNLQKDRVEVVSVLSYSPAYQAGLKEGDVIMKFEGQLVRSYLHLRNLIATSEVGKKVKLEVSRNGENIPILISVGERPISDRSRYLRRKAIEVLGVDIREMAGSRGVKISFVRNSSPARNSGIQKDDILMEIGNLAVRNRNDFNNAIEQLSENRDIRVMISRKGNFLFYHLRPSFQEGTTNN
jgi:serine protease Do